MFAQINLGAEKGANEIRAFSQLLLFVFASKYIFGFAILQSAKQAGSVIQRINQKRPEFYVIRG